MTSLSDLDTSGLRERNVPIHTGTEDAARAAVIGLNAEEENGGKDEKDRKTFGRTPDGTGTLNNSMLVSTQTAPNVGGGTVDALTCDTH